MKKLSLIHGLTNFQTGGVITKIVILTLYILQLEERIKKMEGK